MISIDMENVTNKRNHFLNSSICMENMTNNRNQFSNNSIDNKLKDLDQTLK